MAEYPHDLAAEVHHYFADSKKTHPSLRSLTTILERAYFASMKSEESRNIMCTLAYMDPDDPDPDAPPYIRPQRWTFIPLQGRIPLTVRNLVKLSQAAPSYSSCVAIFSDETGKPFIWGLTDQEIHFRTSLDYESEGHFPRPGVFQIEIVGIGSLSVFDDDTLIAGLRQNNLVREYHDVLYYGPIAKLLEPYFGNFIARVQNAVSRKRRLDLDSVDVNLSNIWVSALCRILLGIRRQEHGGALLLIPNEATVGLDIKYGCRYDKLDKVLVQHAVNSAIEDDTWHTIDGDYLGEKAKLMPCDLCLDYEIAGGDKDDAIQAELGCINFISSLSRVDGLVLMANGFKVRGFGVEITTKRNPTSVYVSHTARARPSSCRKTNFDHYGTRHKSMMRYCNAHPGSVGFVVSQDGDIRAITRVRSRLVIWENIKLKNVHLAGKPKRKK